MHHYIAYGFTPHSQSILEHAHKLEPGHYLVFDLSTKELTKTKYWDIAPSDEITDETEAIHLVRNALDRAVKSRLAADVPVGAFLSGGLDSSAIVAYASKYKKELNTFSVSFDDPLFNEQQYSDAVARHFKTNHHVLSFGPSDVKNIIPILANHYDEPFADPSMIPTFFISKIARKYVTVSLSGDGGDELFGGYTSYLYYRTLQIQNYYPMFLNKLFYKILKRIHLRILEKPRVFFEIGSLPKEYSYARVSSFISREDFTSLNLTNPN